jgi:hypothetical protein
LRRLALTDLSLPMFLFSCPTTKSSLPLIPATLKQCWR